MRQPQVILIGGFLGAGKTTLATALVRRLMRQGRRVGVVTNDQAADLVDTRLLQNETPDVGEVAGACFCCSFDGFIAELKRLDRQLRPDVLIGEPVGSCTDLAATVVRPLKKLYGREFRVAPYSVLVDPLRLRESLASRGRRSFPDSVLYIYRLQIEEADAIVLNKCDQVSADELADLKAELLKRYPGRPVFVVSALTGQGVGAWLEYVLGESRAGQRVMEVDYDLYAEGEAVLGWLNAAAQLSGPADADWRVFSRLLLEEIRNRLSGLSAEIAHAKTMLTAAGGWVAANLTGSGGEPAVRGEFKSPSSAASLIVNVRAHVGPEVLRRIVVESLRAASGSAICEQLGQIKSLSPGRPNPTHRMKDAG